MEQQYIEGVTSWRQAGGLHAGKTLAGSDEFLTYYEDVAKELDLYHVEQFRGKHVWCPCDGADSNFTRYFCDNFQRLGLRHLTATCLGGERYDYDGETETTTTLVNGDMFGDCVKDLWEAADAVITNPPFSRKFDFLSKLLSNHKQFLFLCLNLSAGSTAFQSALIAGQMWLGQHSPTQFYAPDGSQRKTKVACRWYTNLTMNKTARPLPLTKTYDQATAQWIDGGWNGRPLLNVDRVKDIPLDYNEPIACPIGVITDCYDLSDWEVLGVVHSPTAKVNGRNKFARVAIRRRT